MTMQAALGDIQEARRDALVAYYIAYCIPDTPIDGGVPLSDRIQTPDDLYEYLLIDTQITSVVTTSWVAETISSVQLYINRCLGDYDPDVDNAPGSTMVVESKPGGFLYDWDAYNQVYSTWAGKERLQYYPSVYLDPSLRYNKTELFNALEETINQGRISASRVNAGFQQYMLGFETLANLETISGYQAGIVATAECQDTLYFIGRTTTEPYSYYWRSCNMATRDEQGNLSGGAWSQWLKIGAPAEEAVNAYLSPCWFNGRLYVSWLSRTEDGVSGSDINTEPTYEYFVNLWCLREDGGWMSIDKIVCPKNNGTPERGYARPSYTIILPHPEIPGAQIEASVAMALFLEIQNNTANTLYEYIDFTWGVSSKPSLPANALISPLISKEGKIQNSPVYDECEILKVGQSYRMQHVLLVGEEELELVFKVSKLTQETMTFEQYGEAMERLPNFVTNVSLCDLASLLEGPFDDPNGVYYSEYISSSKATFNRSGAYIMFLSTSSNTVGDGIPDLDWGWGNYPGVFLLVSQESAGTFHIEHGALVIIASDTQTIWSYPITTVSAQYFTRALNPHGIQGLLSYQTQTALIEQDGTQPIDFNGSYGLYFWEIFFHSSFLIADRFLNEQNYADAAQWYRYIFAATGYRNQQGELETVDGLIRYWNVVPLQEDHTWNTAIPPTDDPDVIAMNDPMHYKMAIFLNTINLLIEQGDSAYRMLQRDFLAQAKMCYLQASQLLGPRPEIEYNASWPNPTVAAEAQEIVVLDFDSSDAAAPTYLTQALRAFLAEQNGDFLPPYNEELLIYWDKLELRFYNLRHNLSLDGQPLSLPLYADPVSPSELQRNHGAGNSAGGNSVSNSALKSEFRFAVLQDKARGAVNSVIQFGASLQAALERRDNENLTLLLQTQQQQVLAMTQEIQNNNIAVLQDGLIALKHSLSGAQKRLSHYSNLYTNWISSSEQSAMDLKTAAAASNIASQPLHTSAHVGEMRPNIFGMACGGARYTAPVAAAAICLQISGLATDLSAQRLDISEQYRRRREDWQVQRDNAESEVAQLEAQIQSQTQQISMAQKQLTLAKQELANQQMVYNLQTTRFTGLELFNWMSGRLSSLYYQLYDVTLSLCLSCKTALAREIGPDRAGNLFVAPMWNDLYQGLLAGEGLLLELQRMENTYIKDDKRGLEILKTVSLNAQIVKANGDTSFEAMLDATLTGTPLAAQGGVEMAMSGTDKLVISLNIDTLGLNAAYGSQEKIGRLKNISVTLPALLGPYQDVEATLGHGGTYVALSRGLDDSGLFVLDFNDPKYLPFEGEPTDSGTLILTFFHAGEGESQRRLVESLVDVIYQIRYTLKDY